MSGVSLVHVKYWKQVLPWTEKVFLTLFFHSNQIQLVFLPGIMGKKQDTGDKKNGIKDISAPTSPPWS
jgi:hypothetical protein